MPDAKFHIVRVHHQVVEMTKDCTVTLSCHRCLLLNDAVNTGATQKAFSYALRKRSEKYIVLWRHVILLWKMFIILLLHCVVRYAMNSPSRKGPYANVNQDQEIKAGRNSRAKLLSMVFADMAYRSLLLSKEQLIIKLLLCMGGS